jgi:hypothetical protein
MTPLSITDPDGTPLPNPIPVNANGFGSAFAHATLDRVAWAGGGFTGFFTSYEGMKQVAVDAQSAAESAAATAGAEAAAVAEAAIAGATDEATAAAASAATAATNAASSATAAANAAALVGAPADTAIAAAVNNGASATKAALNATYASSTIPALEAVQFVNYGDSYGDGNQGADQVSRPFDRLAVRHRTQPLTRNAQAGTRMDQVLSRIVSLWSPNSRGLVGISDGCINDEKQYTDTSGTATTREAFRASLAYLTAQSVSPYNGSAFVYGPGWTAGSSSTVGSYADVAFTGSTAHLLVSCVTGAGGTIEVRNAANTAVATISTGGYKQNFTGAVKITGTGTTSYRLVLTAGTAIIVGVAVMSPTPPVIVWDKPGRMNSNNTETALLVAYQDACATILGDFPTVVSVDMGAGWDYTTMMAADATHRNDRGNKYAADQIEAALKTYLGSNFQQGLNAITAVTAAPTYTTPAPAYVKAGATAPAAPTGFTATSGNQVTFTWTRGTDGGATITSQIIQSSPAGANTWTTLATVSGSASSYNATSGLTASTSYDFRVAAVNSIGTGTYSATSTATAGAAPATYALDTFNRADSASLGSTETGAFAWSFANATTGAILTNQARMSAAPTTPNTVDGDIYIDDAQANGTLQVTLKSSGQQGMMFRGSGTNNTSAWVFFKDAAGAYFLKKRTAAGAYTTIVSVSGITGAAGDVLTVILNGSSITCKVNGAVAATTTDAFNSTATRHGMWGVNVGLLWDDFSHTSITS